MDKVDTLRYSWEKLLTRASEVQNELVSLQPRFRKELISTVEVFLRDCHHFYLDYDLVQPWFFLFVFLGRVNRAGKAHKYSMPSFMTLPRNGSFIFMRAIQEMRNLKVQSILYHWSVPEVVW